MTPFGSHQSIASKWLLRLSPFRFPSRLVEQCIWRWLARMNQPLGEGEDCIGSPLYYIIRTMDKTMKNVL